jgi:hypothetical protein
LDQSDPVERILLQSNVFSAALLVPATGHTNLAARALARLMAAVALAPRDAPPPAPSTGALLGLLDMNLAAGDRLAVDECLAILRDEWRLDPVNLLFVEVRIAVAFREWPRLVSQPWFDDLCRIPKPAFITQALLDALWHASLEPLADDPAALRRQYLGNVRAACLDLLADLPSRSSDAAAAVALLEEEVSGVSRFPAEPQSDDDRTFRGWQAWIAVAAGGQMRDAASAARVAVAEQAATSVTTEAEVETLAAELQDLALSKEARASLRAALPELVRWLVDDPDYPRPVMCPLYDASLTIFTLLEERGRASLEAMLEVFDALLSLAPSSVEYRRYLQDVSIFVVGEAGTSTVYWLIGLAESLLRNPASDGPARLALLNTILASLQPITGLLTIAQRTAYARVATMANWPPLTVGAETAGDLMASRLLEGKIVALYTLTESAGRHASEALAEAFPGVRVELSSDHVCTPRLRALAHDADLFVVATASAKHAGTDCIQRHRAASMRTAYAAGRGATSILRAVEESVNHWN